MYQRICSIKHTKKGALLCFQTIVQRIKVQMLEYLHINTNQNQTLEVSASNTWLYFPLYQTLFTLPGATNTCKTQVIGKLELIVGLPTGREPQPCTRPVLLCPTPAKWQGRSCSHARVTTSAPARAMMWTTSILLEWTFWGTEERAGGGKCCWLQPQRVIFYIVWEPSFQRLRTNVTLMTASFHKALDTGNRNAFAGWRIYCDEVLNFSFPVSL